MKYFRFPRFHDSLGLLAATGVAILVTGYLYVMAFSRFAVYDDEGCLMILQRGFLEGRALYEDLLSQYGPFPLVLRALIVQAVPPHSWTHNVDRMIAMSFYALAAICFALATFRMTRSRLLSVFVLISCAYEAGFPLRNEPGHPQDVVTLLVAALLLAATFGARPRLRAAAMGALVGALTMTKINAGAFFFAAMFLTAHFAYRKSGAWARLTWIGGCIAAVSLPIALMRLQLFDPTLWSHPVDSELHHRNVLWLEFALIQICGTIAWWLLCRFGDAARSGTVSAVRFHAAWMIPAGLVVAIHAAYLFARGTSLAGFVDGVLLRPLSHPTVVNVPMQYLRWYHPAIAAAVLVAAAGAAFARGLRHSVTVLNAVSILKVAVGLILLSRITQLGPAGPPSDFESSYGVLSAAWACLLLVIPFRTKGETSLASPGFAVRFLGAGAILFPLYAYPLAMSHAVIAGTLVPVLAAVLTQQGFAFLATDPGVERVISAARLRSPALRSLAGLAASAAFLMSVFYAAGFAQTYAAFRNEPGARALRGTDRLHLPRQQYAQYFALTQNLLAHTDRFLALNLKGQAQLNSLYLWTNTRPPTYYNASGFWSQVLRPRELDAIRRALDSSGHPAVVSNGGLEWEGALKDYIVGNFQIAQRVGAYDIYMKKDRIPPFLPVWLLYGAYDFETPADPIPLLDGALNRRPCTISLWLQTRGPGVVLGVQGITAEGAPDAGYSVPALYVGIDGILRCGLSSAPLQSALRLHDARWHHVVLHVSQDAQHLYIDGALAGAAPPPPPLDSVPMAQLGAGFWRGRPGANNEEWSVFRGRIRDAILAPGIVAPRALAGLAGTAPERPRAQH